MLNQDYISQVRLVANVSVEPEVGPLCASNSAIVDPLLDILGSRKIVSSSLDEELVLNALAAITNLLFYDTTSNLLLQPETKRLICRTARPLLLENRNLEACMEMCRGLGNLTRHKDVRKCVQELGLDEVIVAHLEVQEHEDLLYYLCGVLVNLAADPDCATRMVKECGGVVGLLLKQLEGVEAGGFALVLLKVLINLAVIKGSEGGVAPLFLVLTGRQLVKLRRRCQELGAAAEDEELAKLAEKFVRSLPESVEDSTLEEEEEDYEEEEEEDEVLEEETSLRKESPKKRLAQRYQSTASKEVVAHVPAAAE